MRITIGMAHHSDFEGLWATVQAMRLYHTLVDVELVVVDNSPGLRNGEVGKQISGLVDSWKGDGNPAKYVAAPEAVGTSVPRDLIFEHATGDVVCVMDCHVFLWANHFTTLREYFANEANRRDIVSGPILYDTLRDWSTHFDRKWRGEMFGTWGQAWHCSCGEPFAVFDEFSGPTVFATLRSPQERVSVCPACSREFPKLFWAGHENVMTERGFKRVGPGTGLPIEVPGQGLGMFAAWRENWPGFNRDCRGFGGEELWIHDRFREMGGRAICHPGLPWLHRFGRTEGIKYPLSRYGKVRNYVLEFRQTHHNLDEIHRHFVDRDLGSYNLRFHLVAEHSLDPEKVNKMTDEQLKVAHAQQKLTQREWDHLLADPVNHVTPPPAAAQQTVVVTSNAAQPATGLDLDSIYAWGARIPRDLNEHFERIRELASQSPRVTAIVKRREWDAAVLAGRPRSYVSFTAELDVLHDSLHKAVEASNATDVRQITYTTAPHSLESLAGVEIEETDLLILDTVHSSDRVLLELEKHHAKVKHWILVRGTGAFGLKSESGGGPGLEQGIGTFIATHPQWRRVWYAGHQYGMTLLSCDPRERSIDRGPGTELHKILDSLDINPSLSCDCRAKARQMDVWGPDGCRQNRDTIVEWMRGGHGRWGWTDKLKAAALAVTTGLAFVLDWSDPFPSLIDESIRRAEELEKAEILAEEELLVHREKGTTPVDESVSA